MQPKKAEMLLDWPRGLWSTEGRNNFLPFLFEWYMSSENVSFDANNVYFDNVQDELSACCIAEDSGSFYMGYNICIMKCLTSSSQHLLTGWRRQI